VGAVLINERRRSATNYAIGDHLHDLTAEVPSPFSAIDRRGVSEYTQPLRGGSPLRNHDKPWSQK